MSNQDYINFIEKNYRDIKEVKSTYSLKNIIREVLNKLGYTSIKDNEVIIHYLAKEYLANEKNNYSLEEFILFRNNKDISVSDQRNNYFNQVYNYFKDKLMIRENAAEAILTMKSLTYKDNHKIYVKDHYNAYVNALGRVVGFNRVQLNKKDFIYSKKYGFTRYNEFSSNIWLENNNAYNSYSKLTTKIYNPNLRMIEDTELIRTNKFFRFELFDIFDFMPDEEHFTSKLSIRDNDGSKALVTKIDDKTNICEEVPIIYNEDNINYYTNTTSVTNRRDDDYENEDDALVTKEINYLDLNEIFECNQAALASNLIYKNDKDLFSKLYEYSVNDMCKLIKKDNKTLKKIK